MKLSSGDHIIPGAVPNGLGRIVAPSGKRDCFRLLSGKISKLLNLFLISCEIVLCSTRSALNAWAIVSVVKSSVVGPNPPVVIKI